jgi:hypothetical protein
MFKKWVASKLVHGIHWHFTIELLQIIWEIHLIIC